MDNVFLSGIVQSRRIMGRALGFYDVYVTQSHGAAVPSRQHCLVNYGDVSESAAPPWPDRLDESPGTDHEERPVPSKARDLKVGQWVSICGVLEAQEAGVPKRLRVTRIYSCLEVDASSALLLSALGDDVAQVLRRQGAYGRRAKKGPMGPKKGRPQGAPDLPASRSGSAFGNRIATIVLAAYRRFCAGRTDMDDSLETVVAGYVLEWPPGELRLLSLGAGTKFQPGYSFGLRDGHAEVLARRGLKMWLLELQSGARRGLSLARQFPRIEDAFESLGKSAGGEDLPLRMHALAKLHFYTSSAPCGNSVDAKWPSTAGVLSDDPRAPHGRMRFMSCGHGETAATTKYGVEGAPLTCSDKLCLWNVLGVQGGRLSSCFAPVFIDSITVGLKYNQRRLRRALCCRLQGFRPGEASPFRLHHPAIFPSTVRLSHRVYQGPDDSVAFDDMCAMVLWDGRGERFRLGDDDSLALRAKRRAREDLPPTCPAYAAAKRNLLVRDSIQSAWRCAALHIVDAVAQRQEDSGGRQAARGYDMSIRSQNAL